MAVMLIEVFASHRTRNSVHVMIGWLSAVAVLTTGFAAIKIRLARTLKEGHGRTRKTVIGIEIAMTCMGLLITVGSDFSGGMPADFVTLAALVGGCLSLAAAIGLLRRPAREYFATLSLPTCAAADSIDDSNASYVGLRPAPVRVSLSFTAHSADATCHP